MTKIILAYLIALASCMPAFGQVNRTVDGGRFPNADHKKNYVLNYGAEKNVTLGITASTHAVTRSTTTPIFDDADFALTASGAGSVYWSLATLENGLKNQNCEFKGLYEGGGDTWTAVVRSGSNVVNSVALPASTDVRPFSFNVPCGDLSTTYTVGFTTTASAAAITVDNLYFGLSTNLGTVAQAVVLGSITYPTTASCAWSTTTAIGNYSADTDCGTPTVTGQAAAPGTKIPAIVFPNGIPAGQIVLTASANFDKPDASNYACRYRFNDGTNSTSQLVVYDSAGNATGGHLVAT
jgi:hypothetical protein